MIKDQGGTAFPASISNLGNGKTIVGHFGEEIPAGHVADYPGMTLRDYFAAKAMQAAITTSAAPFMLRDTSIEAEIAKMAYGLADAMLAERAK